VNRIAKDHRQHTQGKVNYSHPRQEQRKCNNLLRLFVSFVTLITKECEKRKYSQKRKKGNKKKLVTAFLKLSSDAVAFPNYSQQGF
jgi:hypothetical protein